MSGQGAPRIQLSVKHPLTVAVVASRWHEGVMQGLVEGARRTLSESGVGDPQIVRVPGAFELPLAAQQLVKSHEAVVALGVVIRGGTPHFDYVCQAVTTGLMRVQLDSGRPLGFGLLTCDNEEQAMDRAGLSDSSEDKGSEAALAALAMAALFPTRPVRTTRS